MTSRAARRGLDLILSLLRHRAPAILSLLVLTVAVASWRDASFASAENLRDLLAQSAPVIIVGCGLTLVILTGEIDISVGSSLGFLAALMGLLSSPSHAGLPVPAVAGLVLVTGGLIGLVNGLLVVAGRIPSIIATLGTMTILRGSTDGMLGGEWITDLPRGLRLLGTGSVAGLPYSVWLSAGVALLVFVLLRWTRLGVHILAVGGNPEASHLAGISVSRTRLLAFVSTGLATAAAVLVTVPQQSVIESGIGVGFELAAVTAVVVGGASIRGGVGGVAGTVLAALLLGSVRTTLVFLDLGRSAVYWERAIQGGFILAAVLADHLAGGGRGRAPERGDA